MAYEKPIPLRSRGNRPVRPPRPRPPAAHRVAIVGAGPTGVYTLAALLRKAPSRLHVDIFEKGSAAGPGMPYNSEMNAPVMLSNIASRELPPVLTSLNDWLRGLDTSDLARLGLRAAEISDEAFYPRLALGAYFTAQMSDVIALGRRQGHRIELHLHHTVTDIAPRAAGIELAWRSPGSASKAVYADAVLATGHRWPDRTCAGGAVLHSPWPAEKLTRLPQQRIGVLGTSLSAIDVAVTIASARGRFCEEGGRMRYVAQEGREPFLLSLMSRKGLLPEADYWYDLPLPELPRLAGICAEVSGLEVSGAEVSGAEQGALLDRAYRAFVADLQAADPEWLAGLGGSDVPCDAFCQGYFAKRLAADPFDWARANLVEAEETVASKTPTPWRSALLRAHELFEELIPRFSDAEVAAFHATLKPLFTDCYACVPHPSIKRLLALREAGVLEVLRLGETTGDDSQITACAKGVSVRRGGQESLFEMLIDARGQRAMTLADLGFPSLARADLLSQPLRFDAFVLPLAAPCAGRIHCVALPALLRRHPFVQGLVNASEMGGETAEMIAKAMRKTALKSR
ncbi:FAD/NAD(P)-binding protein [Alloyangia pacifica]|uniref:FAD/NAD(P)-binding protein n=1 Tax=Alloyangia pacifica TaxID=311180 RepID=UPI001CD78C19|nr:FAD/NAD(P)-binding protein [Alloyangia pacifica]MCA0998014.1 FAD/NAD(P)-binding protein [Alloyangia pacifica]